MYGLVNQALRDFIIGGFGEKKWEEVRSDAKVQVSGDFVSMQSYDDSVTYSLATSASKILNIPLEQALEGFGEYWVLYTAQKGYEDLLQMCGSDIVQFLQNLDSMHAKVGLTFTDLQPPSFRVSDIQGNQLHLHYYSDRPALAPMVVGLVKGLAKHFDKKAEVKQIEKKGDKVDHDVFLVTIEG